MKFKLLLLVLSVFVISSCSAQVGFFKPLPKVLSFDKATLGATKDSVLNSFRPVVALSAQVNNGTSLGAGAGVGFEHLLWDPISQSWITEYSISAVGFLTTNGSKIGGTAGLVFGIPGTNGIAGAGLGYDFTGKQIVVLTGVQIQFK